MASPLELPVDPLTSIQRVMPLPEATLAYAAARAGSITGTEYVIDGGTVPPV
jgi:hypothetical protein